MKAAAQLAALEQLIAALVGIKRDCSLASLPTEIQESIGRLTSSNLLPAPLPSTVGELLDKVFSLKEELKRQLEAVPPETATPGTAAENSLRSKILDMRPKPSSQPDDASQKNPKPESTGPR